MAKTKYESHILPKLKLIEAWARDGLTLDEISRKLEISKTTLIAHRAQRPELLNALKRGKEEADINVENSLYKRANGYEYDEITRELIDVVDEQGNAHKALTITKVVTKQVAPDVTAQIYWLKNRLPGTWTERKETPLEDKDMGNLDALTEAITRSAGRYRGE